MKKLALWHEPQYFQFYIQDPNADMAILMDQDAYRKLKEQRFAIDEGIVIVGVISDYTQIAINVEFNDSYLEIHDLDAWDRIIECSIVVRSEQIVFAACPDGPKYGAFGRLAVSPGRYRLRICYGGQNRVDASGETGDYYLVQVWPSSDESAVVLKP